MASKIHILTPDLSNKIAAGEVVQRPASAVKELIENALDAHAKHVRVIIKDAGKSFIQIVDDGDGIAGDDAVLAFERHATSKITQAEDLEAIRTLGFRGEALASIAAVAQVELKTRQDIEEVGTLLRIEGSKLLEQSKTGMERGTSITVKNLFFNTPGRRNFLKTATTELKNITDVVTRFSLIHPDISWLYISDDEVLLDAKPSSQKERVRELFGEKFYTSLASVRSANDILSLEGYAGAPAIARKNRAEQFLYVNKRFVVNRAINHAVYQAYEHMLESGKFPFFILNLTLDPHRVDVNVHPSKMEIKFADESSVYRFVLASIKTALTESDLIPSLSFREEIAGPTMENRLQFSQPATDQSSAEMQREPEGQHSQQSVPFHGKNVSLGQLFGRIEQQLAGQQRPQQPVKLEKDGEATFVDSVEHPPVSQREQLLQHRPIRPGHGVESSQESRAIWQVHNKYILSQIRTGLLIVDQHVAHERILYERVLANFSNTLPTVQQLLFPHTVQLSASEYSLVKEIQPELEKIGFDLKLFGKNTVVIEGIPSDVQLGNEAKILQEVLDEFKNNEHNQALDSRDRVAKSFACKAAIKAGDRLNTSEMIELIDQLFATTMPYVCPHGRPIVVKISIDELDKRFGRA
ncbi:MAG: DNA mismatch repair endonuclease MutL [bacterium]